MSDRILSVKFRGRKVNITIVQVQMYMPKIGDIRRGARQFFIKLNSIIERSPKMVIGDHELLVATLKTKLKKLKRKGDRLNVYDCKGITPECSVEIKNRFEILERDEMEVDETQMNYGKRQIERY